MWLVGRNSTHSQNFNGGGVRHWVGCWRSYLTWSPGRTTQTGESKHSHQLPPSRTIGPMEVLRMEWNHPALTDYRSVEPR